MSLDDQLRAALHQEAESRQAPRPDIDHLIRGGRARRHSRTRARVAVAVAAVTVLVGVGGYGVAQTGRSDSTPDPGIASEPTRPSESGWATTPPSYHDLGTRLPQPGTYRKIVGFDERSGAPIEVDLTFGSRWFSGAQPVIFANDESSTAGLGVLEARALPVRSGCTEDLATTASFRDAATTPDALARQLVRLPSSEVVQPLTPGTFAGYDARHLRLLVDAECPVGEVYFVAEADTGGLGITYNAPWRVVIDLVVIDVDGTPIVAAWWREAHAPRELVDEVTRVWETIAFVPSEPAD